MPSGDDRARSPLIAPHAPFLTRIFPRNLRARIFTLTAALVVTIALVLTALFVYQLSRVQREKLTARGTLLARLVAHNARVPVFAGNRELLSEVASSALSSPEVLSVTIFDRDGRSLVHVTHPPKGNSPSEGEATKAGTAPDTSPSYRFRHSLSFDEPIMGAAPLPRDEAALFVETPAGQAEQLLGTVRVVLDGSADRQQLRALVLSVVAASTLFLALGIGIAFAIARGITTPLVRLMSGVRAIESDEKPVVIPVESSDEIGRLADAFNRMASALSQRMKEQEETGLQIMELNNTLEEKVRLRTSELEAANRELAAFTYAASHDLRAPISRLNGFCHAFREDCGSTLDEAASSYLQRISLVGNAMERVISAMNILFNIQRCEINPQVVDLSAIVGAVAAALRESEPGRAVEVVVQPGILVWGDQELLWSAMENLVGNAWKFTARTARPRIEFRLLDEAEVTVCVLKDNGAGFNMAYEGKLFEPFQRLHGPNEFPGTGVGLAIVQRIIHRLGGDIRVEGEEGRGATCYLSLPTPRKNRYFPPRS